MAKGESAGCGALSVPAWDANTMRSDFAMLAGLPESLPKCARFYPFAFVLRTCSPLASWFELGLNTPGEAEIWHDLTAYLRHLANADAMIRRLFDHLRVRRRDTVLCFYCDYVPALPHIYAKLGCEPVRRNDFVWRNFGDAPARQKHLRIEALGAALIHAIKADAASGISTSTLHKT
jgi:hypothetical protein